MSHLDVRDEDMLFPNGTYSDLDNTQSVFDCGIGSVESPEDDFYVHIPVAFYP